jgi:uracil-DNA glycosylase
MIPVISPVGPKSRPRIAIVGDFPNDDEARIGIPFVGREEKLLNTLLASAEVHRKDCYITKVFREKPLMRDMSDWTHTKTELKKLDLKAIGGPIIKASYLHPSKFSQVEAFRAEIAAVRPNIILALGSIPLWALTGERSIMKNRGSVLVTPGHPQDPIPQKILPTYEIYKLISQWDLYPIITSDFKKAARLSHTPENIIPSRQLWLRPTLEDLDEYFTKHIEADTGSIAVDIETQARQITCIGFASSKSSAIVVPFWNSKLPPNQDPNYWPTPELEAAAMRWCKKVLDHQRPKVFQNGMYDMTYLWRIWGMPTRNPRHDTMLLHHSLQPELMKGLGFLGSIYTDEPSWKFMRKSSMDTEKREE